MKKNTQNRGIEFGEILHPKKKEERRVHDFTIWYLNDELNGPSIKMSVGSEMKHKYFRP